MELVILNDYRCKCGRLLFKGVLLNCRLEIKCKRCGKINAFKIVSPYKLPASFAFVINESGIITDAGYDTEVMLDYPRQELIGKPVANLCPLFNSAESRKIIHDSLIARAVHKIKNSVFFRRDGGTVSPESYCVSRREDGISAGYYIFNWIRDNDKSAQ
ncbi:MAG: Com family DNA-binding transcriptional regulator [Candidatus Pacebacteria bacterium]|nr:Com family DNA-binding transcriptional regulator [Candidatus Paceibacterota bacterium]